MSTKKTFLRSAIVLYFIIAFEVLIMISPFAGFFYSVFNPVLLKVAAQPSTRWLSAFFLPHMVVPPGWFLQAVRVMGSIFFVAGLVLFFICAGQVYSAKFRKRAPCSPESTRISDTRSICRSASRVLVSRSSGRGS